MIILNIYATVKKFVHCGLSEDQGKAIIEAINEQSQEIAIKEAGIFNGQVIYKRYNR